MAMTTDEMYARLRTPLDSLTSLPRDVPLCLDWLVAQAERHDLVLATGSVGDGSEPVAIIGDVRNDRQRSDMTRMFIESSFLGREMDAFLLEGSEGLCDAALSLEFTKGLRTENPKNETTTDKLVRDYGFSWDEVCKLKSQVRYGFGSRPSGQERERNIMAYLELQPRFLMNRRVLLMPEYGLVSSLMRFWKERRSVVRFIDDLDAIHGQKEARDALERIYGGDGEAGHGERESVARERFLGAWQARDKRFAETIVQYRARHPVRFIVDPMHIASGYLPSLLDERGVPYVAFSPRLPATSSPRDILGSF